MIVNASEHYPHLGYVLYPMCPNLIEHVVP